MDAYGWIGLEELENILGFMCAQVVGHDVNFSALRLVGNNLAEKVDKLGAGMSSGGLSDDVTGASVQRGIFTSTTDLSRKLIRYIKQYNKTATPFRWRFKNAAYRIKPITQRASDSVH